MDLITIVMWVSGWWYFTKLRNRIEELEEQMFEVVYARGIREE